MIASPGYQRLSNKQPGFKKHQAKGNGQRSIRACTIAIFILSALLLTSVNSVHPVTKAQTSQTQICIYNLTASTHYENVSSFYYGIEQIILNFTDTQSISGYLTWNLTWDDGKTWSSNNATYTYAKDRTYQFAGFTCYSAWWINPNVQLGDLIRIDGDVPTTNNFLRTAPFLVTDLISYQINNQYFLCWQLSYTSGNHQFETFYFEYHTGILISASSSLLQADTQVYQIRLDLHSAQPAFISLHPILHLWTNYNSLFFALMGATLVALVVYYLLHNLQLKQNFSNQLKIESKILKNEPKTPAPHSSKGSEET